MALQSSDDTILPFSRRFAAGQATGRVAAYLPITIALIGVVAILFGGLKAHDPAVAAARGDRLDPVITGSVAAPAPDSPDKLRHVLEMLDR